MPLWNVQWWRKHHEFFQTAPMFAVDFFFFCEYIFADFFNVCYKKEGEFLYITAYEKTILSVTGCFQYARQFLSLFWLFLHWSPRNLVGNGSINALEVLSYSRMNKKQKMEIFYPFLTGWGEKNRSVRTVLNLWKSKALLESEKQEEYCLIQ